MTSSYLQQFDPIRHCFLILWSKNFVSFSRLVVQSKIGNEPSHVGISESEFDFFCECRNIRYASYQTLLLQWQTARQLKTTNVDRKTHEC